jgi:hypothetical protein
LGDWLSSYKELQVPVLATLSDGEKTLIAALKTSWPQAPHQRCQVHFLNNLVGDILEYDDELRQNMRQDLGDLPKVPANKAVEGDFPPTNLEIPREPLLIWIETKVRQAIRDSVNHRSRKPFTWGGLSGYEQLKAISLGLDQIQETNPESHYLRLLQARVTKVLARNRNATEDMEKAHQLLSNISGCLHYLPPEPGTQLDQKIDSQKVSQEITMLIQETKPDGKIQRAQIGLLKAIKKRWKLFGE